ncbi:MAG: hypothetical protein ACKOTA_10740, partial [Solirubrobacterales bacterium]
MALALSATAIVIVALIWEVGWPGVSEWLDRRRAGRERIPAPDYDPGREQRAENRARQLLRSCVSAEEWEMYRDLGFIRVWGGLPQGADDRPAAGGASYAYLVYPHRPLLAYLPPARFIRRRSHSSRRQRSRVARRGSTWRPATWRLELAS